MSKHPLAKFILIDPSLVNHLGHHHEYARHVLEAAAAVGYEPVLACNRRFRFQETSELRVVPTYSYTHSLHLAAPVWYRAYLRIRKGFNGPPPEGTLPDSDAYSSWWRPIRDWGREVFASTVDRERERLFAKGTGTLLRRSSVQQGDILFVPNASSIELNGLRRVIAREVRYQKLNWHLLFRRSDLGLPMRHAEEAVTDSPSLARAHAGVARSLDSDRLHFYADTDELAEESKMIYKRPLVCLPIPHTKPPLPESASEHQPLRILYVGDARFEKGYHHLPSIVDDLWDDYIRPGKVEFVIQSHGYTPLTGDQQINEAREQLKQFPADKVRLIHEPLDSSGYWSLLKSGSIFLLPYNRESYESRSSGVAIEALALGLPIVVPQGTWMARQLAGLGEAAPGIAYSGIPEAAAALRKVVDEYPQYRRDARSSAAWWYERHNASRLIEILVSASR